MAQVSVGKSHSRAPTAVRWMMLFLLLISTVTRALAAGVTLAWDPVASPLVAGYMLHYGPSAGNYTSKIDVGNATSRTVSNLVEGAAYHFAVTAYNAGRAESGFSNDVRAVIPYASPVADFNASTTSGPAPLALNFTNASTGNINTYAWSFGDGTTSTAQNPGKVYSSAGSYTVSLTVTGAGGNNTKVKTNYVTVTTSTAAPIAAFSGTPTSGTAPLTVNFTSTSSGTIASYAWNFGDGTTSSAQNPAKVYSTPGSYTVNLTVTGPGGTNTKSSTNYVTVSTPPTAPGAVLTANVVSDAAAVNLTSKGTSDWAQWPGNVRKASGGGKIGALVHVGQSSPTTYANDPRAMEWSDGSPAQNGSTNNGVSMSGIGSGFQISAPADTTTRTLSIYLGAFNAGGTLTAHLSDGSAADWVSSYNVRNKRWDGVATITYRAASAGQTVTVKWIQNASNGRKPNASTPGSVSSVSLQGAALAPRAP